MIAMRQDYRNIIIATKIASWRRSVVCVLISLATIIFSTSLLQHRIQPAFNTTQDWEVVSDPKTRISWLQRSAIASDFILVWDSSEGLSTNARDYGVPGSKKNLDSSSILRVVKHTGFQVTPCLININNYGYPFRNVSVWSISTNKSKPAASSVNSAGSSLGFSLPIVIDWIGVICNCICFSLLAYIIITFMRWWKIVRRSAKHLCLYCGYPLGTEFECCSECGKRICNIEMT